MPLEKRDNKVDQLFFTNTSTLWANSIVAFLILFQMASVLYSWFYVVKDFRIFFFKRKTLDGWQFFIQIFLYPAGFQTGPSPVSPRGVLRVVLCSTEMRGRTALSAAPSAVISKMIGDGISGRWRRRVRGFMSRPAPRSTTLHCIQ